MNRDVPPQDWHSELYALSPDIEVLRRTAELQAVPSPHGFDWRAMTGVFGPAAANGDRDAHLHFVQDLRWEAVEADLLAGGRPHPAR